MRGRVYRSTDDGASWELVPNEQRVLIATALSLPGGVLVFAGQSRALFLSRDQGQSLVAWAAPLTSAVAELVALPDGSILALGEAGATVLAKP